MGTKLTEEQKQENKRKRAAKTAAKHIAALGINGGHLVDRCNYCGAINVPSHKTAINMCAECGELYVKWYAARRANSLSKLRQLKPQILRRYVKSLSPLPDVKGYIKGPVKYIKQVMAVDSNTFADGIDPFEIKRLEDKINGYYREEL